MASRKRRHDGSAADSKSAMPAVTSASSTATTSSSKADLLYVRCAEDASIDAGAVGGLSASSKSKKKGGNIGSSEAFTQSDLLAMGVVPDLQQLLPLCQQLISLHRFQIVDLDGQTCYRVRPYEFAERLRQLGPRELLVYNHIDQASTSGIWTKTLKSRTNLHQTAMTRILKTLESKNFVKQTKLVKYPGRKIYMRFDLDPGDDATGGPWYSDGELDVGFVESIAGFVVDFVKEKSWREGPRYVAPKPPQPQRTSHTSKPGDGGIGVANGKKTSSSTAESSLPLPDSPLLLANPAYPHLSSSQDQEHDHEPFNDQRFYGPALSHHNRILVPHEPGYMGYPTPSDILNFIDANGIVTGKDLTLSDLRVLLDMLVFDHKLERMGTRRRVRDSNTSDNENDEDDEDDEDEEIGEEEGEGQGTEEDEENGADSSQDGEDSQDEDDGDEVGGPAAGAKRRKVDKTTKLKQPARTISKPKRSITAAASSKSVAGADEEMYRSVRWPLLPTYHSSSSGKSQGAGKGSAPGAAAGAGPGIRGVGIVDPLETTTYDREPGNGLSEVPCLKCPVFRLCEEGGPVDARSCAYFPDWLSI